MKRFVEKITAFTPGWIQDVNYTTNPGFLKLKNAFINLLGKIQKYMGWEVKKRWTQPLLPPGQEEGRRGHAAEPDAERDHRRNAIQLFFITYQR